MTSKQQTPKKSAAGRPRTGEQESRKRKVLEAALGELVDKGYEKVTMLGIAKRANASKETLYSWFGDKSGLFRELITRNGNETADRVAAALGDEHEPEQTLIQFSSGLISLLTSGSSIALNRAAMTSPELAGLLLTQGRHRVGPIVESYLKQLQKEATLRTTSPAEQFTLLYGLVIRDTQIRVLLGEPAPTVKQIKSQAQRGVKEFLSLECHPIIR